MRTIRGRLMKSMEEDIVIRREEPLTETLTFPLGESPIKGVILPAPVAVTVGDTIEVENRYLCNIIPPQPSIRRTDQVIRNYGQPTQEVLTVTESTTVQGTQQLNLENKERSTA